MVPTVVILPSVPQDAHMAPSGVPYDQLTEEEDYSLVDRWFCTLQKHHPKVASSSTAVLFQDIPERQ